MTPLCLALKDQAKINRRHATARGVLRLTRNPELDYSTPWGIKMAKTSMAPLWQAWKASFVFVIALVVLGFRG